MNMKILELQKNECSMVFFQYRWTVMVAMNIAFNKRTSMLSIVVSYFERSPPDVVKMSWSLLMIGMSEELIEEAIAFTSCND